MKTILIIDDENLNLITTKIILEKNGYGVVTANSADAGIRILKEIHIDLILMDIQMPEVNGIEAVRKIRQIDGIADTKVLFLTASDSREYMQDAIRLGACGFIKKPCMPEELIKAVEGVFGSESSILILVVDDESTCRLIAKRTFEKLYRVECVSSGEDALKFLENTIPSLILMDQNMPGMSGEETYAAIKKMNGYEKIPVVFLTSDEDDETELRLFKAGASDFIRKPYLAEIARERVRRILELSILQEFLYTEVERKTKELRVSNSNLKELSTEIVYALAGAIDAKDEYTSGHSERVARYSREIARRLGKSDEEVEEIYMVAMLHDVGKIGISNDIINKPGRLDDEEFAIMKSHSARGAKILETISKMPNLSIGAHWHHERYDGKGYPDGLAGENIPEIARIVCVADCYDAMSSNRSYRKTLPQEIVRGEIEKGIGTQFDPRIAHVMLRMIDEDKNYDMREK